MWFNLWLNYGAIWANIIILIDLFFDKIAQWDMVLKPSFKTFKDIL